MAIIRVMVNHTEKNWFGDYVEVRNDEMCFISDEKIAKAIDKLRRMFLSGQKWDCLFVVNDDNTGWRLSNDIGEGGIFVLTHYVNIEHDSWDTMQYVGVAEAKRVILGQTQKPKKV